MICMISQPTFVPWLGWFDVANQSDIVVLLDTVQFNKRSWQQRNRIRNKNGLEFLTVPVITAGKFKQSIREVQIVNDDLEKYFINKLKANYSKSPHFDQIIESIKEILPSLISSGKLSNLNEGLIRLFFKILNIEVKCIRASDLPLNGRRSEYLANICNYLNCNTYISTSGAAEYLKEDRHLFDARDITVLVHNFIHPTYKQISDPFIPYASTLDLIMMHGDKSGEILRDSKRQIVTLEEWDAKNFLFTPDFDS
jgi:hypothetical protein